MTANPLTPIPPIGPTTAMGAPPPAGRFKPVDPLRLVRQYAKMLIVVGVVGLAVSIGVYLLLLNYAPSFESVAQLQVLTPTPIFSAQNVMATATSVDEAFMQTQAIRLTSEDVASDVVKRNEVRQTQWYVSMGNNARDAVQTLQEMLSAKPMAGSTLIQISMKTKAQSDAPIILNAVIDVYLSKLRVENEIAQGNDRVILMRAKEEAEETIRRISDQIRIFTTQNDLPSLRVEGNESSIHYNALAKSHTELLLAMEQARKAAEGLLQAQETGAEKPSPEMMAQIDADPAVARRDEELRSLREGREQMLARFGPNHPQIRQMDQRADAVRAERQREVDKLLVKYQTVRLASAQSAVSSIEGQIAVLTPELQEARARMTDLTNKLAMHGQMETQLEIARQNQRQAEGFLRERSFDQQRGNTRVTPYLRPTQPTMVSPKAAVVIPGITIAFLAAASGLAYLFELLDQRLKTASDVKLLPNVELLGALPDGAEDPSGATTVEGVVQKNSTGLMAESFRHIRTALLTRMDRRGYKTLLVATPKPGGGVSAIVNNLALSVAQNGRKVLVIDANLRRPAQHEIFGIASEPGLVELLQDKADPADCVRTSTADASVDVLPAGHTADAPPELLEGNAFRRLLTGFEGQYDLVIIDAPPALLASDSQLLAKHVDALVIVIRAMRDHRGMAERVLRLLDGQRADLLGIILNGVQSQAGGYLRKNYQEFYRYSLAGRNGGAAPARNGHGKRGKGRLADQRRLDADADTVAATLDTDADAAAEDRDANGNGRGMS
jgi:capsular exopolysaccharide synthesis family protein